MQFHYWQNKSMRGKTVTFTSIKQCCFPQLTCLGLNGMLSPRTSLTFFLCFPPRYLNTPEAISYLFMAVCSLSFPQIMSTFSSQLRSPKPWWMLAWISKQWYIIRLCSGGTKYLVGLVSSWGLLFPQGCLRRWDWRGLYYSSVKLEMWYPWVIHRVNIRQFEVEKHSITYLGVSKHHSSIHVMVQSLPVLIWK